MSILGWSNEEGSPVVLSFYILFNTSQDTPPLKPWELWVLFSPGPVNSWLLPLDSVGKLLASYPRQDSSQVFKSVRNFWVAMVIFPSYSRWSKWKDDLLLNFTKVPWVASELLVNIVIDPSYLVMINSFFSLLSSFLPTYNYLLSFCVSANVYENVIVGCNFEGIKAPSTEISKQELNIHLHKWFNLGFLWLPRLKFIILLLATFYIKRLTLIRIKEETEENMKKISFRLISSADWRVCLIPLALLNPIGPALWILGDRRYPDGGLTFNHFIATLFIILSN